MQKILLIKILNTKSVSTKKYKSQLFEEGKFKVIPFSNNYFKIYLKNYEAYKISYNNKGITIKIDNNMCEKMSLNDTDFLGVRYIGNFPVQKMEQYQIWIQ